VGFHLEVLDAICRQRAVRSFQEQPVDQMTMEKLLDAAVRAPSALNRQSRAFAVIQDGNLLKQYSDRAKRFLLFGALSLKTDVQGKIYSTASLRMEIEVDDSLARPLIA